MDLAQKTKSYSNRAQIGISKSNTLWRPQTAGPPEHFVVLDGKSLEPHSRDFWKGVWCRQFATERPAVEFVLCFAKAAAKCWVPSQPSKRRHRNNSRSKPFRRLSFSSQYCHMASSTDRRCSFRKRHTDSRSLLVSRLSACCLTVANGSCRSMLSSMNRCSTSAALLTF